ncbi:MAG: type II secretion system GspH family protein [Acidiferrobacterales bacterium]|nr:type II secretion system GspH family protein [Acidiferrobacterales bacterium]
MQRPESNSLIGIRGFTLIEIIVTVAIIGIVVAFVGVNISRDTDRLARLEAKRFHVIVNEVRDEAIIAGSYFLLTVDAKSNFYEFMRSEDNQDSLSDDGLLKRRNLEPGVELEWDVFEQLTEDNTTEAQVVISPLGEITPFDLSFSGDDNNYHVFVNDRNLLEQKISSNQF